MIWKFPSEALVVLKRSHPLLNHFCAGGFTFGDVLRYGISPVVIQCNEEWKPILEIICAKDGYCWEWNATDSTPSSEYYSPMGEAVLTKVG